MVRNAGVWNGCKSLVVAFCCVAASGCAQEEESLIVVGVPTWQADCSFVVPASVFKARGTLDVKFETGYFLPLELRNQLQQQSADSTNSGIDASEIQVVAADVTLSMPGFDDLENIVADPNGSGEALIDFSPPLATDSLAGGNSNPVLVEVIVPALARALAAERRAEAGDDPSTMLQTRTILADVSIRGRRSGNRGAGALGEVESRSFTFPIDVCVGCLATCATCVVPNEPVGTCPPAYQMAGFDDPFAGPPNPAQLPYTSPDGCSTAQDGFIVPATAECANE